MKRTPSYAKHYGTLAALIDDATEAKGDIRPGRDDWRYGKDWPDEATTRAGLVAGDAPAEALAAYEIIRAKQEAARLAASEQAAPTRRRRQVWADQGDEIDPDRLNTGHATPWRTTKIGRTAPIVRLGINIALSCFNTPETFADTIARAVSIVDTLTLAGYSIEIIGIHASTVSTHSRRRSIHERGTVYTWIAKAADEPLDTLRLLSLSAPGLCRAYCHALLHRDTGDPARGICQMPHDLAEIIETSHIIGRHWPSDWRGWREIDAEEQIAAIIAASTAA